MDRDTERFLAVLGTADWSKYRRKGTPPPEAPRPAPPEPSLGQPDLGRRVRECRLALGLTQDRLGQVARVGNNTVARLENGGRVPPDSARRIVAALWPEESRAEAC